MPELDRDPTRSDAPDELASAPSYDPESFWEGRLRRHFNLTGAGFRGIGAPFNQALYRQREIVFARVLRRVPIDPSESDVVELGPGTGFYVALWKRHHVRSLVGLDITAVATARLAADYPEFRFAQADISERWPLADRSADIVTAFDVLFHIVDDVRFAAAIDEAARVTKPGGHLFISDLFPRREFRGDHQASRTLEDYRRVLDERGFFVVGRLPVFVTMHPALDLGGPLRAVGDRWWSWLERRLLEDPQRGHRLGRVLGYLDRALTVGLPGGPSTEVLIARRR